MLKIRLSRIGKKNKPMYRLTIAENARDPYGRALEILGSYNPYTKELIVKKDRIEHWLEKGAQMSDTANNLLVLNKIIDGEKVKSFKVKKKEGAEAEKEANTTEKKEETKEETTEDKPAEETKENPSADSGQEKAEEKKEEK